MDNSEKINQLQRKIELLAGNINLFEAQLRALQNELDALRKNELRADDFTPIIGPNPASSHIDSSRENNGLENFIGLRFMHIVGIVVLVIGLSIGVKYAIDRQLISEAMRVGLAYVAGLILFLLSLMLKKKYHFFSAILFSGSMASLYFTTYAAFVYYQFFPLAFAFAVMVGLTVYTVIAAINYNRQEIAILGMIGAYGIPFLISANADRVDLFFSYILLINGGVAFISFRRSWKWMQYLALLLTWVLFIGWEIMRYESSLRDMGILFMSVYYILFFVSAIARRLKRAPSLLWEEIQQIVVNNVLLYLAAVLLFGGRAGNLASTTGCIALFTGVLALLVVFLLPSEIILQRLLGWQAITLMVMFIGFRWDGLTVTLLWMAVAVCLFMWGIFYKRSWPRMAAIVLTGVTLGKLIFFDSAHFSTVQKIIAFLVIGVLLLLFSFYYQKFNLANTRQAREK